MSLYGLWDPGIRALADCPPHLLLSPLCEEQNLGVYIRVLNMRVTGCWHSVCSSPTEQLQYMQLLSACLCFVCVYTWLTPLISLSVFVFVCIFVSRPAMQQASDNVGELSTSTGAKDIDLLFLRGIMESPTVRSLVEVAHTCRAQWGGAD